MRHSKIFPPWEKTARLMTTGRLITDYLAGFFVCIAAAQFFPLFQPNRFAALEAAAILILIFWMSGLYKRDRSIMNILETQKLCQVMLFVFLILGAFFIKRHGIYVLFEIAVFVISVFVVIGTEKFLFFKIDQYFLRKGIGYERSVIYNHGETGKTLAKRMLQFPKFGKFPVGFLGDKGQDELSEEGIPVLGNLDDDFEDIFKSNRVDTVIVAKPEIPLDLLFSLEQRCRKMGIKFELDLYLCGMYFIETFFSRFLKRTADLVFSTLILLMTLPLSVLVIFLIKCTSPGPAVFKQNRMGKDGKIFTMFKFRTMYAHVNEYDLHPSNRNDERLTKTGKILRYTSLDELPQLFNVIKGEMSLVGPRPEMPFIVEKYDAIQKQRLLAKPGMTGLWQISADRSRPIHENIEYDLYYIQNQSLLLDLAILLRTPISVIGGLGAF